MYPPHPLISTLPMMNAIITHYTSTPLFPHWQGASIPKIPYIYYIQGISVSGSAIAWLIDLLGLDYRSNHQRCSIKKGVLVDFTKFTAKRLCQSLWHRCFRVNFVKCLRTTFLQNTSGRLLLDYKKLFSLLQFQFFLFYLGLFDRVLHLK